MKMMDGFKKGYLVWSNKQISNSKFLPLNGQNITRDGSTLSFMDYVKTLPKTSEFFCSESEYNSQVEKTGTCGKFIWYSDNIMKLPKTTETVQKDIANFNLSELKNYLENKTCCFCYPSITAQDLNIYDEAKYLIHISEEKEVNIESVNGYMYLLIADLNKTFTTSDNIPGLLITNGF